MSREERRQYQRTVGKRAQSPYPSPPTRRARGASSAAPSGRSRGTTTAVNPADGRFTRRFWTWTLGGAALIGLFVLSVSWDPQSRPGTDSLMYGVVAAVAWILGVVGYRLARRRVAQRDSG